MSNLRTKVMGFMQHHQEWMTAAAVADAINTHPMNVHRIMRSEPDRIERATMDTGRGHGGRFVAVFRVNENYKKYTTTELALKLAKQHAGMFGQLYWIKNEKILHRVSERQGR